MIIGNLETREVRVYGEPLDPMESRMVADHSPDGFAWGYGGSGPAQLALAILLKFTDVPFARANYQDFKREFIEPRDADHTFVMQEYRVLQWVHGRGYLR